MNMRWMVTARRSRSRIWLVILALSILVLSPSAGSVGSRATQELDIGGVEWMFSLPVDDWEALSREGASWVFQSLINLARLQFGLTDRDGEFERILREEFFYYFPEAPRYETVDVERKPLGPAVRKYEEEFEFDVGGDLKPEEGRSIWITFLKKHGNPAEGYEWGIGGIKYERFVDTGVRGVPGTEERIFWFNYDLPTPKAYYVMIIKNPDGTEKEKRVIAEFTLGNPNPVD